MCLYVFIYVCVYMHVVNRKWFYVDNLKTPPEMLTLEDDQSFFFFTSLSLSLVLINLGIF